MSDAILSLSQRPRTLSAMHGQEKTVAAIRSHVAKRPPRTWMFSGDPGVGKTSIGLIMAVSYQCAHMKLWGDPCEDCYRHWQKFAIHEINAAVTGGVEDIESLCRLSYSRPMSGQKRVIIIDEAQAMSAAAFKALLKPTETPPEHTVWIFLTSDLKKIPAANQRRPVKYHLKNFGLAETESFLTKYAKRSGITRELSALFETCHTLGVGSPGVLLQALEKYAAGATASDAVTGTDGATVNSLRVCKAVTNGDWAAVKGLLATMGPEDARYMRASLAGWLKGSLLKGSGGLKAAESLIELSQPPFDSEALVTWLVGVIYKTTRRFGAAQ